MADPVRRRGALKAKLTRLDDFVQSLVEKSEDEAGQALDSKDFIQLRKRLEDAGNLVNQFDDIQLEIDPTNKDSDSEYLISQEFEDKYYQVISRAEDLLQRNDHPAVNSQGNSVNDVGSNASLVSNSRAFIKLPTINLPSFSGKPEEWLNFRDLFSSLIDTNEDLTNVQKLHYLRSSLIGKAAESIKGLSISSSNYKIAWDGLIDRYNNSRALRYYHIKELFNLEGVSRESSGKLRNLIDSLKRNLRCLDSLMDQAEQREAILIHILQSKLDSTTIREFENQTDPSENPSLDELISFVERKASLMETIEQRGQRPVQGSTSRTYVATVGGCPLCGSTHSLYACNQFKRLNVRDRQAKVKHLQVCYNCLAKGHFTKNCRSKFTCSICKLKHHSLLHQANDQSPRVEIHQPSENTEVNISAFASNQTGVLLPTVLLRVFDNHGRSHRVKALLDSGSMSSFISCNLKKRLKLPETPTDVQIQGITSSTMQVSSRCKLIIHSHFTNFKMEISCLVAPRVIGMLPFSPISTNNWDIPQDIKLANPDFGVPTEIDILLGASYFWSILCPGQISLGENEPILQNTHFGWVVSGPIPFVRQNPTNMLCNFTTTSDIDQSLRRFWELEEVPSSKLVSKEDLECENHFKDTVRRDITGRFVVSIPLKENPQVLGDSLEQATRRFLSLERRLASNPKLHKEYSSFMKEYERLGHMTAVSYPDESEFSFYLPHHGVVKENSLTTKLRVVFDGSASTSTGISLNDIQRVGPVIQSDLFSILIRFREYMFVFSADIEKMYRQILVTEDQRPLQRILWRASPEMSIVAYNLNTVTYGTAAASFLATRCLQEVGAECAPSNPALAKVIQHDFYVDDCLSGSNSLAEAQELCALLSKTLSSSGFPLRKWLSNDPRVLEKIESSCIHPHLHDFGSDAKTLGLFWSNNSDKLFFSISDKIPENFTKRTLLSDISQVFDPIGLLSPCVMSAKFLLQALWLEKISWDDPIPPSICDEWSKLRRSLPELNKIQFSRNVICENPTTISLHAFSDASIKGYGACVYIRSTDASGRSSSNLLCSKGKVAPLKYVSIPRMELCGALTLVRLVGKVLSAINAKIDELVFWTDSTIVLSWLKMHPNRLKVFVANRIQEIQGLSSNASWRHVPSQHNPADMISRGAAPSELANSRLWTHGPEWLTLPESYWPTSRFDVPELPELKTKLDVHTTVVKLDQFPISDFSDLVRLKRVVAFCLRFASNCAKPKYDRQTGPLCLPELKAAMDVLVRIAQADCFARELDLLKNGKSLKSSRLLSLNPFLDDHGIIRVGGRIRNSSYDFDKKHPVIILGSHPLAQLIVVNQHKRLLHAGPQLLLSSLREKYWVISGRNLIKRVVHSCVRCFRFAPKTTSPVMGNLPSSRIEKSYPFQHTGIDYSGPFLLKDRRGRGNKLIKGYICLFVCFCTKAVHLELVSDLSSDAFIQTLRRFVGRRGRPSHIYSDNGTNFVGANSKLRELGQFLRKNAHGVTDFAVENEINWHFIPGHSPHFGGIWEAGVKSSKYHLKRVVGNASLTFEEFYTVLCQVEAVLNSRPLTPLSPDPTDLEALTPGHFLIGRSMTSTPDADVLSLPSNRLSRFQHVQQLAQHFWSRWSREYVGELQQRTKWRENLSDLKMNSLVLVKHDNLPPMKWQLGRVIKLHPGEDGVNRVASVQTASGVLRRSFSKICPLPVQCTPSD